MPPPPPPLELPSPQDWNRRWPETLNGDAAGELTTLKDSCAPRIRAPGGTEPPTSNRSTVRRMSPPFGRPTKMLVPTPLLNNPDGSS